MDQNHERPGEIFWAVGNGQWAVGSGKAGRFVNP